jgi:hypothetical protein
MRIISLNVKRKENSILYLAFIICEHWSAKFLRKESDWMGYLFPHLLCADPICKKIMYSG